MKQNRRFWAAGLIIAMLVLAGCVQEVERDKTVTPAGPTAQTPETAQATQVPTPPLTRPTAQPTREAATASPTTEPALDPTFLPPPELKLEVSGPVDGDSVSGNAVVVHGVTTPGAMVEINEIRTAVDRQGRFQEEVGLAPGVNPILVVAVDSQGNRETRSLAVTSLVLPNQPFLLLVTEPRDQSVVRTGNIRLSGRTGPLAVASVNGVAVAVDEFGIFSTSVALEPGPNIIDVVATDNDGQVLTAVIAVIYRQ